MIKPLLGLLTLSLALSLFAACKNDNKEEDLPPVNNNTNDSNKCDTSGMTFTGDIDTFMTMHCVSCHSGQFPSAGISLVTYAQVKTQAPGFLDNIRHDPGVPSHQRMPQGLPRLDSCTIAKIEAWVHQGMPQ